MRFLFNKRTGLSVYGAGLLVLVLTITAAIAGILGSTRTNIDPETNADYKYYRAQSSYDSFTKGGFFEKSCSPCHMEAGKGPASFAAAGRQKLLEAVKDRTCPGYKFDKKDKLAAGRCNLCHYSSREELQFDPEWSEYSEDPSGHPDVAGFYEHEITDGELQDMERSLDFQPRLNSAQYFALVMTALIAIGIIAWCSLWVIQRLGPKKEQKYLA